MKTLFLFGNIIISLAVIMMLNSCDAIENIDEQKDDNSVASVNQELTNVSPKTTIENSAGVKLTVPQGAIPKADDGTNQPLLISIEKKNLPSTIPLSIDGYEKVGDTWYIKPNDFVFQKNLSLEIPFTYEEGKTYSIFHLNESANEWEPIAFSIHETDTSARYLNFVSSFDVSIFDGGSYTVGGSIIKHLDTNPKKWGVIKFENMYIYRDVDFCISGYELKYPETDSIYNVNFRRYIGYGNLAGRIHQPTSSSVKFVRLPQGKYKFNIARHKTIDSIQPAQGYEYDGWFTTTKWHEVKGDGIMDFDNSDLIDHSTYDDVITVDESTVSFYNTVYTYNPANPLCKPTATTIPGTPGTLSGIEAIEDAYVYAYSYRNWNNANFGAYDQLAVAWNPTGGESRTYLKFDFSSVTDATQIQKAVLRLYQYSNSGNANMSIGIYNVTSDWQEGSGTYHSGEDEQTAASGELSWTQQPTIYGSAEAIFNPGNIQADWVDVDITPMVMKWLTSAPNNGLVIKAEGALSEFAYRFASKERDVNLDSPQGENKGAAILLYSDDGLIIH